MTKLVDQLVKQNETNFSNKVSDICKGAKAPLKEDINILICAVLAEGIVSHAR